MKMAIIVKIVILGVVSSMARGRFYSCRWDGYSMREPSNEKVGYE